MTDNEQTEEPAEIAIVDPLDPEATTWDPSSRRKWAELVGLSMVGQTPSTAEIRRLEAKSDDDLRAIGMRRLRPSVEREARSHTPSPGRSVMDMENMVEAKAVLREERENSDQRALAVIARAQQPRKHPRVGQQ